MRTPLNLTRLVLAGLWLALGHVLAGILFCALIITIPFGIASFRIAAYALWPFGRTVVPRRAAGAASFTTIPISLTPLGHEIVRLP